MSSLSSTMHALQAAIRDGTYRPEIGAIRSMEQALRRMTPEQLEDLRYGPTRRALRNMTLEQAKALRAPAAVRLLTKTVEER